LKANNLFQIAAVATYKTPKRRSLGLRRKCLEEAKPPGLLPRPQNGVSVVKHRKFQLRWREVNIEVHSERVGAIVLDWRDAHSLFSAKPETQEKFSIPPPVGKHTVCLLPGFTQSIIKLHHLIILWAPIYINRIHLKNISCNMIIVHFLVTFSCPMRLIAGCIRQELRKVE
jgi:hypothetical protein